MFWRVGLERRLLGLCAGRGYAPSRAVRPSAKALTADLVHLTFGGAVLLGEELLELRSDLVAGGQHLGVDGRQ